jgi:hypothetical protein
MRKSKILAGWVLPPPATMTKPNEPKIGAKEVRKPETHPNLQFDLTLPPISDKLYL